MAKTYETYLDYDLAFKATYEIVDHEIVLIMTQVNGRKVTLSEASIDELMLDIADDNFLTAEDDEDNLLTYKK